MDSVFLNKLAAFTQGIPYTHFGVSDHDSLKLRAAFTSDAFFDALKQSKITHIAVELPGEFQGYIDALQHGSMSRARFDDKMIEAFYAAGMTDKPTEPVARARIDAIAAIIQKAAENHIRVSGVDSVEFNPPNDPHNSQRMQFDRQVAANIAHAANGEKTAILYGFAHQGIAQAFGPSIRTINLFTNRARQVLLESAEAGDGHLITPSQIISYLDEGRSYITGSLPQGLERSLGIPRLSPATPVRPGDALDSDAEPSLRPAPTPPVARSQVRGRRPGVPSPR